MNQKKIPLRRCVVTNESLPKKELLRIVRSKDGKVFIDLTSKANGRGAYIKLDEKVILEAKKRKCLSRALDIEIQDELYEEMLKLAKKN